MRDTIKPQDYFLARIQADTARIKRFEETLKNTEPSNERGIRLGKSQLSKLYLDCAKTSYSMGAELGEVYSYYIQSINYYKDTCTPADSLYGVIDYLSIGVLFQRSKQEFLSALEIMAEKFNSQDGLICCLLQYLQDKGKGASPLPLRPAPVPAPVCAAPLCWMGGFGGGCNEKRFRRFWQKRIKISVLIVPVC